MDGMATGESKSSGCEAWSGGREVEWRRRKRRAKGDRRGKAAQSGAQGTGVRGGPPGQSRGCSALAPACCGLRATPRKTDGPGGGSLSSSLSPLPPKFTLAPAAGPLPQQHLQGWGAWHTAPHTISSCAGPAWAGGPQLGRRRTGQGGGARHRADGDVLVVILRFCLAGGVVCVCGVVVLGTQPAGSASASASASASGMLNWWWWPWTRA